MEDINKAIMKNSKKEAPPIGVMPYWIALRKRIRALAGAIERWAMYMNSSEVLPESSVKLMRIWTTEIMQLLDVVELMDEMKDE